MALSIARPKHRWLTNPYLFHLFSTSCSSNDLNDAITTETPQSESPSQSESSVSSYFSDVKASLRHQQKQMENQKQNQYFRRPPPPQQQSSILNGPSKIASFQEVDKYLSESRRRSSIPPLSHPRREQHISFQELYKRHSIEKLEDVPRDTGSGPPRPSEKLSFEAIGQSLRQVPPNEEANTERRGGELLSFDALKDKRSLPQQQQSSALNSPSKIASLEKIKKILSEFRPRSSVPLATDSNDASAPTSREQTISFQELYKHHLIANSEDAAGDTGSSGPQKPSGKLSFDAIRHSLKQMRPNKKAKIERRGGDPMLPNSVLNKFWLKSGDNPASSPLSPIIGGTGGLPRTVSGKEMKEGQEEKGTEATRTDGIISKT